LERLGFFVDLACCWQPWQRLGIGSAERSRR
jgi:hypothetical protein